MVVLQSVQPSNHGVKDLPEGLVAVFIGATSGIGKAALKQFAKYARKTSVWVIGRSATTAAPLLSHLGTVNSDGKFEFIEKDASLVQAVDDVASIIKSKETKIDYLFVSAGFISFEGRQETREGLDSSMSTRYYARIRAIQLLLPLLNASNSPHVVSVLGGGQEGVMNESDLDLRDPKHYSILAGNTHTATMMTLALERFATENPRVSFVHAFSGLVRTPTLTRGSSGIIGILLRWIVAPLVGLFAMSPDEAGARTLFYATSARYTVSESQAGAVKLVPGLDKATKMEKGLFLVGEKSESTGNSELLADYRKRRFDEKVWRHTTEVFDTVNGTS